MSNVSPFFRQIIATIIVLALFYLILSSIDIHNGGINGIRTFIYPDDTLLFVFMAIIYILISLIAGLPIRLLKRVNDWWIDKPYLSILGMVAAIILLVLSFTPSLSETITYPIAIDKTEVAQMSNANIITAFWLVLTFSVLHFYPLTYKRKKQNL